jgi:drug/metabolite transporter (DMT)-like permease
MPVHWRSAIALFLYAIAFSLAYLSLPAGTGALILFGAVQTTMLATALWSGERPRVAEWIGLAAAVGGLVYLIAPGLTAPPFVGALLMAIAGISWGLYSLWGRRATDPLADTTVNFVRALPFAVIFSLASLSQVHLSVRGSLIAMASGALASGLGYVAWYAALPQLTTTRAATVQLAVPVIAGAGGVVFLSEAITGRLLMSAALVLGGIALAVLNRRRR